MGGEMTTGRRGDRPQDAPERHPSARSPQPRYRRKIFKTVSEVTGNPVKDLLDFVI